MAALDFPDNPNVNDTFTVGSREWIWDGSVWVSNSGRDFTRIISDNAPGAPIEGDEWFDSSNGRLYIYYDNNWVEVGASVSGQDGADATLTRTIRSESANTSLVSGDANQVIRFTGTETQTLTVDDVLSPGDRVEVIQDNSGAVEFSSGSGVTLLSTTGGFTTSGQNAKVEVMCVAAGEYRAYGDVGEPVPFDVESLVIAGGGSGGSLYGGGGGAGGYRSSVTGESSGGGANAESALTLQQATNYTVTIGAGGAGVQYDGGDGSGNGNSGNNSVFASIVSVGGGFGAGYGKNGFGAGGTGGSGGGAGAGEPTGVGSGGAGTSNQGFDGGNGIMTGTSTDRQGGGGGGASQAGVNATTSTPGAGGDGVSSSVTDSPVTRAGGGGAAGRTSFAVGGNGGGGNGGYDTTIAENGAANTGGGGGGERNTGTDSGNGGSGVVILRYPSDRTITIGAGLTGTTSTVGDNKVTTITAGTGNVSFS